jgi:hypothetical protein
MRLEWVILADAAEVVNSKLYLMGGGWDTLHVNTRFPVEQRLTIAVSLAVGWIETNQRHRIELDVQDEKGGSLASISGHFEVGRPPEVPPGEPQRFQMAVPITMTFGTPGRFVIVIRVNNEDMGRWPFRVVPGPMLALRQP